MPNNTNNLPWSTRVLVRITLLRGIACFAPFAVRRPSVVPRHTRNVRTHPLLRSLCYLRLRQLMKEDTCVLCKSVMDRVMVCTEENIRCGRAWNEWHTTPPPNFN